MTHLSRPVLSLLTCIVGIWIAGSLCGELVYAQSEPSSLSISPGGVFQGEPYTMTVGNGANMTLDVRYQLNGGPVQTIFGWPSLNSSGQATVWTDAATVPGTYTFVAIRNSLNTSWVPVAASIVVWSSTPAEPTSLSIAPSSISRGQSYTMTVGNGANMTLDVRYQLNGGPVQTIYSWPTLNSSGQATIWTDAQTAFGTYTFVAIRNTISGPWLPVSAWVTVTPQQPTSLSIAPSSVIAGQGAYMMSVGNGANLTLDVQYRFNGGAKQTIYSWPTLNANGVATIWTGSCTVPGTYTYTDIRNTLDTQWLAVNASIAVSAAAAPTVVSVSPAVAKRNSSVSVTLTGTNLCGASLSTTLPGLTFSNITSTSDATVTATFNISSTANSGPATVLLTAHGLTTNFTFGITSDLPPTISGLSPGSGGKGTSVPVVITGANLYGASLSTTWSGLTFANVISSLDGMSINARFDISTSAALGNPAIQVTTAAGSVTTTLFSIAETSNSGKEFIYLGNKLIAVRTATPPQP